MTDFIGLSLGVLDNRVYVVADSYGRALSCREGLTLREVFDFLWSLRLEIESVSPKPIFAGFEMSIDFELLFGALGEDDKNKLFGIRRELEESVGDIPLYDPRRELDMVSYADYKVWYLPGKLLRLSTQGRAGMAFYDIAGYFEAKDLTDAAEKFLGSHIEKICRDDLPLFDAATLDLLIARCHKEALVIADLGRKISATIEPTGLNPRSWYGPSAIAASALNKWGARRQGKKLTEKNAPYELVKAVDCAYFGGRIEAIKLGTIKDVRVFDLNSAYAYATTLLSQFHKPLTFTRRYVPEPFSVWFVEYMLPSDTIIGPLPTRATTGGLSYRQTGRGYFWQPEIDYLMQRYPGCYEIRWGYAGEYNPVTFAPRIEELYTYRMKLKDAGDAGQTIVKLALSNLYGKFAQNKGAAYFQCRAWAGWITSFIRRLLLEAVTGVESSVICFSQDAVHLEGVENPLYTAQRRESRPGVVSIDTQLGGWKRSQYSQGTYVAPGIYELTAGLNQGTVNKQANCGSNLGIDFQRIASDLSARQASELSRAFFVGWNLATQSPVRHGADYLTDVVETLNLIPSNLKSRNYVSKFDWATEYRDSSINRQDSGLASARYHPEQATGAVHLRLKDRGWA